MSDETIRHASCSCGQLTVTVRGEPLRVSICHCHNCQRRSGSAFAWQARWPTSAVDISGEARSWYHPAGDGGAATFSFCPTCGATMFYRNDAMPGEIAVAMGGFAGEPQLAPLYSVYEERLQPWLSITGDDMEHFD